MDQMDPNTVSGLLKLHLREHPLLSHQSISVLDKAMSGDKVNKMSYDYEVVMLVFTYRIRLCQLLCLN